MTGTVSWCLGRHRGARTWITTYRRLWRCVVIPSAVAGLSSSQTAGLRRPVRSRATPVAYSLSPLSPVDVDTRLLMLARTRGHTPARERTVAAFSRAGEHAAGWLALGLVGAGIERRHPARRGAWLGGTGVVAASYVLNTAIKFTVRRPRPVLPGLEPLTPTVTGLSFPSAHATTSFAAARAFGTLVPATPLYGIALLIALSRVYLGVHYPSDILGGALFGTALAMIAQTGGVSTWR